MSKKSRLAVAIASIICIVPLLGGCSNTQGPTQTKDFSLADVKSLEVDYDGESVTVKESDSDRITVVEYMDKSKKSYFAKMDLSGGILTITEGARPIGNGVHSYIEIYLPKAYQYSLSIHTTDGQIISNIALTLSSFRADTTNGTIELSELSADTINLTSTDGELSLKNLATQVCKIATTNANTRLDHITGTITFESKGGDLALTDACGSGNFQATGDGNIEIAFSEVSSDLDVTTKNGKIALILPDNLSFAFSATTKNGNLQTPFSESLSRTGETAEGTVGNFADVKIGLETKNGDIEVNVQ